jgi:two-component system OmpR family response regulator
MPINSGGTILVVDDDMDFLILTKRALERDGYRVETRATAPTWTDLQALDPSLVLMDVDLGGESGVEACRAIKAHRRAGELPIILISGMEEDSLRREADSCHADGFISKPVNPRLLLTLAKHYTNTN